MSAVPNGPVQVPGTGHVPNGPVRVTGTVTELQQTIHRTEVAP